jgi:AcrR family transcriptional regulator
MKTNSPSDTSAKTENYHHGDLRNGLTHAAMELLEETGLAKLSLRATARRAGVSAAAPYHHFKDKTALLEAVATQGFEEFTRVMREQAAPYSDPADIRAGLGAGYVVFAQAHPALFRLMFAEGRYLLAGSEELSAAAIIGYELLRDAVAGMALTDTGKADTLMIERASASSWAQAHGLAMLVVDGALNWPELGYDDLPAMAFALLRGNQFAPHTAKD